MTPGLLLGLALVGVLVFCSARPKKKRTPADWYIDELKKAKARRTSISLGRIEWLTRAR